MSDGYHLALEVFDSGAVALAARDVVGEYSTYPGRSDQEMVLDQNEVITYTFLTLGIFSEISERAGLHCQHRCAHRWPARRETSTTALTRFLD
ncbi:hypothetical protein [Actinoplanes subtropicus]|uniref:hypothetical protein n=1 Tax=Actinoplanes subtropicus TaxID=543632 RepID=UPI0004C2BEFE|nr:hypothetical protein [Actinoplanes subtropicus]